MSVSPPCFPSTEKLFAFCSKSEEKEKKTFQKKYGTHWCSFQALSSTQPCSMSRFYLYNYTEKSIEKVSSWYFLFPLSFLQFAGKNLLPYALCYLQIYLKQIIFLKRKFISWQEQTENFFVQFCYCFNEKIFFLLSIFKNSFCTNPSIKFIFHQSIKV